MWYLTLSFSVPVTTVGLFTADKTAVHPCLSKPKNYDYWYSPSCSSTLISYMTWEFWRISHRLRLFCIFFNAHAWNCLISTLCLKSDIIVMFLDPDFLYNVRIPAIREHLRQKYFHFGPKWCFWRGRIGEGVVQRWHPNEPVLTFWGCYLCATWRKSIKKCNFKSKDRQTHVKTETNWIYNLPHAICYSYGANKKISFSAKISLSSPLLATFCGVFCHH